jgi:hypothetical protein
MKFIEVRLWKRLAFCLDPRQLLLLMPLRFDWAPAGIGDHLLGSLFADLLLVAFLSEFVDLSLGGPSPLRGHYSSRQVRESVPKLVFA